MPDTDYEYSVPQTVGGLTGVYSLRSPFPQDSEVAVLSVTFTDTGYIFVGPDASPPTISNTTAMQGQRGQTFNGTANFNITPDALFWKMDADQTIYINVSITASHAGLVTLIFRRHRKVRGMENPAEHNPEAYEYADALRQSSLLQDEHERERRGRVEGR